MSYKIIVDSCGELTKEMKESGIFESVALGIEVGGHHIVDDETFDQADFLKECQKVRNAQNHPAHPRNDIWKVISVMHSVYMQ